MQKAYLFPYFLLCFVLVACASSHLVTNAPTVTPTPIVAQTIPSAEASPTMNELGGKQTLEPTTGSAPTLRSTEVITPESTHQLILLRKLGSPGQVGGYVTGLAFSPNGSILVTGSRDGLVKLYNIVTGDLLTQLDPMLGRINSVAFSHDGKLIAVGGGEYEMGPSKFGVRIWDVASQEQLLSLNDFSDTVNAIAFSPDGETLATVEGNRWGSPDTMKVWDLTTGKILSTFFLRPGLVYYSPDNWRISSIGFNPEGTQLAIVKDIRQVVFLDVEKNREFKVMMGIGDYRYGITFSPDGRRLAIFRSSLPDNNSDEDNDIRLWDIVAGELLIVLEGYEHGYNSVAFSPDGKVLAAVSEFGIVRRWDLNTREVLAVLEVPGVHNVALSPDGTLIATGGDIVRLWGVPSH